MLATGSGAVSCCLHFGDSRVLEMILGLEPVLIWIPLTATLFVQA